MNIYIPFSAVLISFCYVLFTMINNPEKIDKWTNLINRFINWLGIKREKQIIASNLDYKITTLSKNINKECYGILPYGLRINWKDPKEASAYLNSKDNKVIVVLKKDDNLDKNIIEVCQAYIPLALLPKSRNVIDCELLETIDNFTIKKLLSSGKYDTTYNYFMKNVLDPKLIDNITFKAYFDDLNGLDTIGFFTRVFLNELSILGTKIYQTSEELNFKNETKDFLNFVSQYYKRQKGSYETKIEFIGSQIKISIVLLANRYTLHTKGIKFYCNKMEGSKNKGVIRIYLFSYPELIEESIIDEKGYVTNIVTKKEFQALSQIKDELKSSTSFILDQEAEYFTKDNEGKHRDVKYMIYETV